MTDSYKVRGAGTKPLHGKYIRQAIFRIRRILRCLVWYSRLFSCVAIATTTTAHAVNDWPLDLTWT